MTVDDYKRTLQKARKDLEAALEEKQELDLRIASLRQVIAGLAPLAGVSIEVAPYAETTVEAGITQQIKRALARSSSGPLTAPQIRDYLVKDHFDMSGYASPLTVIHNTLARLERQGEVKKADDGWILVPKQVEVSRDKRTGF